MSLFVESKTVQEPFAEYLRELGWEFLSPEKVDRLRGSRKNPFLTPILLNKLLELNPKMTRKEALEVISRLNHIRFGIEGNEEFLRYLHGEKTFYSNAEGRELNLKLIDFDSPERNVFQYTVEFKFEDRRRIRLDLVLFINGIPIAVGEFKSPALYTGESLEDWVYHAFNQIKGYHSDAPSLFRYLQFFFLSEGLHLIYSGTWNFNERNLYKWKTPDGRETGLEELVATMFSKERILGFLEDYIVFFRIDDELNKYILRPHQIRAVEKIVRRVLTREARTGLIWHTQGSGKTLTMMVAARKLRRIRELENPTIIIVVDRRELQSQLATNLEAFGLDFVVARSKQHLRELLETDYRGIIVTLIHKFQGMPSNVNTRENIIVFIDEAHRSQEGDLGIYMRAALPNAFYFGFTGTPIDRGKVGKGTFKLFAQEDMKLYRRPYLDKYNIKQSISDGTTVPLYYTLAPQEYRLDRKTILEEFFRLYEEKGIASIEELNKLLDKATKIKEVMKAYNRIKKIAKHIVEHFRKYVEPSGFKAFVVAVDREACALYMEAFKELYKEDPENALPPEYFRVVYTSSNKDNELLRKYWITPEEEKRIRRSFRDKNKLPKIFIVTEKLLTGYDAPILQTMYLDKPMKDHTLLQAIARVNRPYYDEELKKTAGVIVDYVGIFEDLQRALAFDSESIEGAVIDFQALRNRFVLLMEELKQIAGEVFKIIDDKTLSWDKKTEKIVEIFSEEKTRRHFMNKFKELQEIFEILSPDPFLKPYMNDYKILLKTYRVVRGYFYPADKEKRELLRKTKEIIRKNIDIEHIVDNIPLYRIDEHLADLIKSDGLVERIKIYNLRRSLIIHIKQRSREIPFLEFLIEKIEAVIRRLEERQISAKEALEELLNISKSIVRTEKEYETAKIEPSIFSIYQLLKMHEIDNLEAAKKISQVLLRNSSWTYSRNAQKNVLREIYKILKDLGIETKKRVKIGKDILELGKRLLINE